MSSCRGASSFLSIRPNSCKEKKDKKHFPIIVFTKLRRIILKYVLFLAIMSLEARENIKAPIHDQWNLKVFHHVFKKKKKLN